MPKSDLSFRDVQRWKLSEKQMCKRMFTDAKPGFPGGFTLERNYYAILACERK